jgi:pimeloyl-ACP methyl ester carboxylesterase
MPFAAIRDGRLFFKTSGEGPPIVLIHGAWGSQEWWRWQVSFLSLRFQVLTLDLRGHGQSSPIERPYSIPEFAQDLSVLLQSFGNEPVPLVGWSMGGMVSLQFCLNQPSRVKALVLIGTRGHLCRKTKRRIRLQYFMARLRLLSNLSAPRKYDRAGETFPGEKERAEAEIRYMLGGKAAREVIRWVQADLEQNPRSQYFNVARSFWDWDAGPELARISTPTLIMVGEKDDWVPPVFSHRLHKGIPGSRLIVIEGAGHHLPLERPARVNFEIGRFLQEVGH